MMILVACSGSEFRYYYLTTNAEKVRERPKDRLEIARARVPSNNIGFLPI
jgi:hypothetical protein